VLEICERHGIGDWDLGYAYEALARACLAAGDRAGAREWLGKAHAQLGQIAEAEDRDHLREDLATIEPRATEPGDTEPGATEPGATEPEPSA
jgi:hypothetical protein